ncbi:MAG TPA: hypothetical protein VM869_34325 [Enhygromyxa sp.]|nr:hypothetical protein [Enhygromyxa sp.]
MRSVALLTVISLAACSAAPTGEGVGESSGSESSSESGESEANDWADSLEGSDSETGDEGVPVGPAIVDYETCIVDPGAPTANLIGETPLGQFSGQYAWFGWLTCNGDAISPTLVIGESPQDLADALAIAPSSGAVPKPSLEWFLLGNCSPENGWVGEGGGGVTLRTDGPWELGNGVFAITQNYKLFEPVDPDDPPTMKGELAMNNGEWSLSGEFTAVYCGALSYPLDGC